MTPQEKVQFRSWFPNLNVDAAVVTGEATPVYNCISWTVGVTDRWLWPGGTMVNFDTFYRGFGFVRGANGPVAAWGRSTTDMTHGSVSGPGHGPRWESKCGASLRIQHGLNELVSNAYGHVLAFYTSSSEVRAPFAAILEERGAESKLETMELTVGDRSALEHLAAGVPEDLRQAYETAFAAWKATWFSGNLALDSNPYSRASGREFDALLGLGPEILPLVVKSLADDDNFLALPLYESIQPDHRMILESKANHPEILDGEQGRAGRVVRAWLSNLVQ
ncbi:MAG TPA: hypothetical protein VGW57_05925 [Chthoniobacterales bacterium]|nr:hypothetical protein [Chthoniobacterales bacterium]